MTETELKQILENIDPDNLQALENYYNKYNRITMMIDKLQTNLETFKTEYQKDLRPTQREQDLIRNLKIVQNLPKKRRHKVEGTLNETQSIDFLAIDGKQINPELLQSREYSKMFFKKSGNYVNNAIMFLSISIILYALGINNNFLSLQLISVITLFQSFMNILSAINDNSLNTSSKTKISQKKLNTFAKALSRDYEKEHTHSENMHLQNLAFLDSKEDVFEKIIEKYQGDLAEITEEIRNILQSEDTSVTLTEEEQLDTKNIIEKGYQKVLKK